MRDSRGGLVLSMDDEPAYHETARWSEMQYTHPRYGDLVVIDHNNHAVRHWGNVPRVISSEIEAWRIEALQRTVGISISE